MGKHDFEHFASTGVTSALSPKPLCRFRRGWQRKIALLAADERQAGLDFSRSLRTLVAKAEISLAGRIKR